MSDNGLSDDSRFGQKWSFTAEPRNTVGRYLFYPACWCAIAGYAFCQEQIGVVWYPNCVCLRFAGWASGKGGVTVVARMASYTRLPVCKLLRHGHAGGYAFYAAVVGGMMAAELRTAQHGLSRIIIA